MRNRGGLLGFVVLLLGVGAGVLHGQSADLMMRVQNTARLDLGSAAALVGIVGGSLPAQATPRAAPDLLRKVGFAVPAKPPGATITVGEFSYLTMQLLDLRGGLLYSIFPGPRYAVRELEARTILPAGTHPGSPISGAEALRILGMLQRSEASTS